MDDLPGHKPTWAPGMSQVIEAGESYTLTDSEGKELELVGKLDKPTVDFIRNFDMWIALQKRTGMGSTETLAAWKVLEQSFNRLGNHARKAVADVSR